MEIQVHFVVVGRESSSSFLRMVQCFAKIESSDLSNTVIPCAEDIGPSANGVRSINTEEGWVLFYLRC